MAKQELRRVQLRDGKFILEGKIVDAKVLSLVALDIRADGIGKFAPDETNAYFVGRGRGVGAGGDAAPKHQDYKVRPILYLRINHSDSPSSQSSDRPTGHPDISEGYEPGNLFG